MGRAIPGIIAGAFLAAILTTFLVFAIPRVTSGGPDIGSLMIGTPDEHEIAAGIHGMLDERTLDYKIPAYPGLYPMLAFIASHRALKIVAPSERNLVLCLRWFSLVFGLLSVGALFALTRLLTKSWLASAGAAAYFATAPELMIWAVRIHPDTLLIFLLILSQGAMALAVRRRSQAWLNAAYVLAVLAMLAKLVGFFLLPCLLLVQAYLDFAPSDERLEVRGLRFAKRAGKAFVLLCLLTYATTPQIMVDMRRFFEGMAFTSRLNSVRQEITADGGWFEILWHGRLAGPVGTIIFFAVALSFVPVVAGVLPKKVERWSRFSDLDMMPLTPMLFAIGFFAYLLIAVENYQWRYALPILPNVALAVGVVFGSAWNHLGRLKRWFDDHPFVRAAPAILLVLLLIPNLEVRRWHLAVDMEMLSRHAGDPRIEVARWFQEHAPENSRIIFDYGGYVPLRFRRAGATWGLIEAQIVETDPNFVVIRDDRRAMFTDPDAPQADESAARLHRERARTLALLERGELHGLRPVKRFHAARTTVYQSETAPVCPKLCTKPWAGPGRLSGSP